MFIGLNSSFFFICLIHTAYFDAFFNKFLYNFHCFPKGRWEKRAVVIRRYNSAGEKHFFLHRWRVTRFRNHFDCNLLSHDNNKNPCTELRFELWRLTIKISSFIFIGMLCFYRIVATAILWFSLNFIVESKTIIDSLSCFSYGKLFRSFNSPETGRKRYLLIMKFAISKHATQSIYFEKHERKSRSECSLSCIRHIAIGCIYKLQSMMKSWCRKRIRCYQENRNSHNFTVKRKRTNEYRHRCW